MNKITVRYAVTNYYKQEVFVSDELYDEVMDILKTNYDEEEYKYYDSFEKFVDDVIAEVLEGMGVELTCEETDLIDSDGTDIIKVEFA